MSDVPTGVKVISVLYYIGAVLSLILGIICIVASAYAGSLLGGVTEGLGFLGASLFIILGIIMIGFAVLSFFVGRGLWKAQSWARIVAIILSALGVVNALIGMVQGEIAGNIISLIVGLVIGGYLLFSKNVKEAFA